MTHLSELPDLLTVKQYATWAERGINQAYDDVRKGRVPAIQLGGSWRVVRAGLERMLADACQRVPESTEGPDRNGTLGKTTQKAAHDDIARD